MVIDYSRFGPGVTTMRLGFLCEMMPKIRWHFRLRPFSANVSAMRISACIICKNEADKIITCLDSLAWCDDIVVVDSGSTDGTPEKAGLHAAKPRVIQQTWLGYNQQREFAVNQCRHEWVLALDADEECSPELAVEIKKLDDSQCSFIAMFQMPRKNYIARRWVRCWSPDYQGRLVHKHRLEWDAASAPEIRRPKAGSSIGRLKHPLLHNRLSPYIPTDINDGPRMAEHAAILADSLRSRGRRATFPDLFFRPALTFFKYYMLRGGFLQGRFGLVICYKTTIGVMLKYSVLFAQDELAEKSRASSDRT